MRWRVRLGRLIDVARVGGAGGRDAIRDEGDGAGKGLIVSQGLEGGAEEVGEEGDGDGAGAGLLAAVASDEAVEGFAGFGDEGEGEG